MNDKDWCYVCGAKEVDPHNGVCGGCETDFHYGDDDDDDEYFEADDLEEVDYD